MTHRRIVIALGGNAILPPGGRGTAAEQQANIRSACQAISRILAAGDQVVVVHGNGPQVGNLLLQAEQASRLVPPLPLDACVAQTQGLLGYWLQQELQRQSAVPTVSLVTQVTVDPTDPAFATPSKPIGRFYTAAEARGQATRQGWPLREDAGRGWRRVVPSPLPLRVVETAVIRQLLAAGCCVIAGGGGGIPVAVGPDGLAGVAAVIDKDLTAALLATETEADLLLFLTGVPGLCLNYGRPDEQALGELTAGEAEAYLQQGAFAAGSMQPKVTAALRFIRQSGKEAVICALAEAATATQGCAGTRLTP